MTRGALPKGLFVDTSVRRYVPSARKMPHTCLLERLESSGGDVRWGCVSPTCGRSVPGFGKAHVVMSPGGQFAVMLDG